MKVPFWSIFLFLLYYSGNLTAQQCAPSDEAPGPYICWPFTASISGSTANFTAPSTPPNFCETVENNGWFSFSPCNATASFTIIASGCRNGLGVEAIIYDQTMNPVSNCFTSGGVQMGGTITANNLIPGQLYYFMIDGYKGDECSFVVSANEGLAPPTNQTFIGQKGYIQGPSQVCSSSTSTYEVILPTCTNVNRFGNCPTPDLNNYYDTTFLWSIPTGGTIIGDPNDRIITVEWNNLQSGDISVTMEITSPNNSCLACAGGKFTGSDCPLDINDISIIKKPTQFTFLPTINLCDGECYDINYESFCEAGHFQINLVTVDGCDSIVEFDIILHEDKTTYLPNQYICEGECINIAGQSFCSTGEKEIFLNTSSGCDSIVIFEILEKETYQSTMSLIEICEGEPFDINGQSYTRDGKFNTVFQAANGCDSTVSFEISIIPKSVSILPQVGICPGDCYILNGVEYCESGVFKQYRINSKGCDSTIVLEIIDLESDFTQLPIQSICEGECFIHGGREYCEKGKYELKYQNQFGCDSIVEFELNILEKDITQLPKISLCEGECYNFKEQWFCEAGKHKVNLFNKNGCDSIVNFEIEFKTLNIDLTTSDILTIGNTNIQLAPHLDGSHENLKIEWQGFDTNPDSLNPTVTNQGTYIVTVTDTILGCSSSDSITIYQLEVPPSTTTVTPSNNCTNAPFLCGSELNGYSGKTDSITAPVSNYLQQFFTDSLENPQWIEWTPCDSTAIVRVGVLNSLLKKGVEFSVLHTASCETFTNILDSKKINYKTVENIQINNLTDDGHYYFVLDGIDGDISNFQIEIERGIQTEPLQWKMVEAPQIRVPVNFCPDIAQSISITEPVYELLNEHCSFLADITPIQEHTITWNLPVQSTTISGSNTRKEIVFNTKNLLSAGEEYLQNGTAFIGTMKISFEPKIVLPDDVYCTLEQPAIFEENRTIKVRHSLQFLQTIEICESSKNEYCGRDIDVSEKVICRNGCTTTVQQINVNKPVDHDYGYIRICPGECYVMPITRKRICTPGKYTEPILEKCGGSETVEIGYQKSPEKIFISSVTEICDPLHTHYQISFDIREGRRPYQVNGEYLELSADRFISQPIPNGAPYRFVITDASTCVNNFVVEDQYTCGPVCQTDAGKMSSTVLELCANQIAEATHFNNSTLDLDDGQEFILHNSPTKTLGQILARSTESDFAFLENEMDYDQTYYISSVVGDFLDGQVDLKDPCLSVSEGQPIIFKYLPSFTFKDTFEINCRNNEVLLSADFIDSSQVISFEWTSNDGTQSATSTLIATTPGAFQLDVTADNSCSISKTIYVVENFEIPHIDAGDTKALHCEQHHLQLDGQNLSLGNNFTHSWTTVDGNILDGKNTLTPRVDETGTYKLITTNTQNGCQNSDSVKVIKSTDVFDNATFDITLPSCHGKSDGKIAVNQVLDGMPPYTYSFDGNDFTERKEFNALKSGTYEVLIKDAYNCILQKEITLLEPPMVAVELGDDEFVTLGQEVMLTAASTISPHKIEWWSDFGDSQTGHFDWTVQPTETSNYYVRIEDRRGCFAKDQLMIIVKESDVFIPTGFSPNQDKKNDFFTVFGGESVNQVLSLKIYNRAGNLLFENYNFPPNDELMGWNGIFRGKQMFADVYVFLTEVEFINGDVKVFQGDVTLLR